MINLKGILTTLSPSNLPEQKTDKLNQIDKEIGELSKDPRWLEFLAKQQDSYNETNPKVGNNNNKAVGGGSKK